MGKYIKFEKVINKKSKDTLFLKISKIISFNSLITLKKTVKNEISF